MQFPAGFAYTVHAITQAILTEAGERVSLYFLPLQIHPLHSPWHYATPSSLVKDAWKNAGPFLTLGWPQDTTALEDGCITDEQFLSLCDSIFESRKRIFFRRLEGFKEGVLAGIFDCLDRVQHMFLRGRTDIVEDWYLKLDGFVGEVQGRMDALGLDKYRLLFLSDHGFQTFEHKVNLNYWLVAERLHDAEGPGRGRPERGGLVADAGLRAGAEQPVPERGRPGGAGHRASRWNWRACWRRSAPGCWSGARPDGSAVISRMVPKHEAFNGPYPRLGPDLVVGYAPRYRASSETGLGKIGQRCWKTTTITGAPITASIRRRCRRCCSPTATWATCPGFPSGTSHSWRWASTWTSRTSSRPPRRARRDRRTWRKG